MGIAKLADALESCVVTNTGGWANERALSRFNKLARALEKKLEESEGRRRIGDLFAWAKLLYSTRRHRRWSCGVEQLRQAILAELARVRMAAPSGCAAPLPEGDPSLMGTDRLR